MRRRWKAKAEAAQVRPVIYREEPARRYTSVETEVLVPTFQAGMVSLAWGILAGLVTGLAAQPLGLRWWAAPAVALAIGAVLFAVQVTRLIGERRDLLWRREEIEGRDLNGDGEIGKPQREIGLVYVKDPARERRKVQAADFRYFLKEAYNGAGTTWRAWKNAKLPSGARVTRPTWERYTERLIRAGLASRPYDTAALEMSGTYREALAAFRDLL